MRISAFIAVALLLLAASTQAATVAIVRPSNPPPLIVETLVHLQGELTSLGFSTELLDEPAMPSGGRSSPGWLEQLGAVRGVDAVVALVGDVAPDAVELWVVDKVTGKSVVRRVPYDPKSERAPKTLAIRAIELLRSSFLEIDLSSHERRNQPAGAPPPAVVRLVGQERLIERPERFGVEVGGAAIMSVDGVGPALLPLLSLDWAPRPWGIVQLAFAGLGTRSRVAAQAGNAQVAQEYVTLGVGYRPRARQRLRPFAAVSVGALHTSVEGQPAVSPPDVGHHAEQWSFLLEGAAGAHLHLRDRFYLALAARAQVAEPYVAVRFVGAVAATSARPNLLGTLTIGAWL